MVWGRAFQAEREGCEPESQWGPQVTRDDGTRDTPGSIVGTKAVQARNCEREQNPKAMGSDGGFKFGERIWIIRKLTLGVIRRRIGGG